MVDEREAVKQFKNGNIEAFNAIYLNYYRAIYFYINKMVGDKTIAEDLTQETFIKVVGGMKHFDEDKKLSSWIFRIAHNICVDYHRKHRLKLESIENIICCDTEVSSPEYCVLNKEKQFMINAVLLQISRKHRIALVLREFNNLTYREIAEALRLSESTVKSLIYRARQQFQKAYANQY